MNYHQDRILVTGVLGGMVAN